MPSFLREKCQAVNLFMETGPLRCSEAQWGNLKTSQIFFFLGKAVIGHGEEWVPLTFFRDP